jgi:tRNA dimethylallyltransferase
VTPDALPRTVHVIVGPTASGKSDLAMRLAGLAPMTIVSADSRQVYRGFDIGTAKPSREERERVPHAGIDVADPGERYSAARWAAAAGSWIATARAAGRTPVLVGGTGFYLRAVFEPLADVPELDDERRRALENVLGAMPIAELRRWCEALDGRRAHLGRAQLLRAVVTALLAGERLSDRHALPRGAPTLAPRYLVLDPGPTLRDRIERRVDRMLEAGWLGEVHRLADEVPADAPAWNSTGYDALRAHIEGSTSLEEARERVIVATRQYAKRQRTWFRHQLGDDVTRIDPTARDAWSRVIAWWKGEGIA